MDAADDAGVEEEEEEEEEELDVEEDVEAGEEVVVWADEEVAFPSGGAPIE